MKRALVAVMAVIGIAVALLVGSYSNSSTSGLARASASTTGGVGGCQLAIDPAVLTPAATTTTLASYTQNQLAQAALIVARGKIKTLSIRGQLVALITALQESRLRVLANPSVPESAQYPHDGVGSDHDSIGTFQQRPSQGWGTVAQIMDPTYAADTFYTRLVSVSGWETMAPTAAAQTVQGSAFPDAYAKWTPVAAQMIVSLGGVNAADVTGCRSGTDLPTDSIRATIVAAARRMVGLPYVFNAGNSDGPTRGLSGCDPGAIGGCDAVGFDCSGLSMYAWAQAGVTLDHYAATQYTQGKQVPVAQAQPGDLLFYATDTSDTASIHHVTVYVGNGLMIEAPQSGQRVNETIVRTDGELLPLAVQPIR